MTNNRAMELLYDSEASLRLVDHELDALREFTDGVQENIAPPAPGEPTPTSALALVPGILQRANAEIVNVLQSLRQCRSALENATTDKLQITHEKIREVTCATETAATGILDGLDRAQALIDELDAEADGNGSEKARDLRNRLRDEIFTMTGHLQFQDITTQQLTYAASVLVDMESRLSEIARLFDPRRYGAPELPADPRPIPATFTPDATITNAEERQALADEVFTHAADDR
ncbi:MAG: hypothetical protein ACYC2G_07230 [Gemmatimonadaceae bacterium]